MQQADQFVAGLLERHPLDSDTTVLVVAHNAILRCLMLTLWRARERIPQAEGRQHLTLGLQPQCWRVTPSDTD